MAKRYIGNAVVTIEYRDRGDYAGSISVPNGRGGRFVWKFENLNPPRAGFSHAYDSAQAYDKMAGSAVSFGAYYETGNRGHDTPDWAPRAEVADAISNATAGDTDDQGTYYVRRTKTGKAYKSNPGRKRGRRANPRRGRKLARRANCGRVANPRRGHKKTARRANPRKTLREFIREHREEIDAGVRRYLKQPNLRLNDEERRQWVLNDEGLYNWARSEGVRV